MPLFEDSSPEPERRVESTIRDGGAVWTTWALDGPEGVITFTVRTGGRHKPMAWGVDGHRRIKPSKKDREYLHYSPKCSWTGGKCWCDGTALGGSELFERLSRPGEDSVMDEMWSELRSYYDAWLRPEAK